MRYITLFLMILFPVLAAGQVSFDKHFTDKVLRFDYMLA